MIKSIYINCLKILLLSMLISQIQIQSAEANANLNNKYEVIYAVYVPNDLLVNVYITDKMPEIENNYSMKANVWCENQESFIEIYTHNVLIVEPLSRTERLVPGEVSKKITDCVH